MAGIDLASQRMGVLPGFGLVEGGFIDFSAASRTLEVPTRLTTCLFGFAIADSTQSGGGGDNYSLTATTDCDVSGGNVTFKRQGVHISSDARFRYLMIGW